jgi:hypothetical protein
MTNTITMVGGAARPCSGVDLMNPCHLRGGRPCTCSFQCRHQSDLIDLIKKCRNKFSYVDLYVHQIRACLPATMVAKTAPLVVGGGHYDTN